MKEIQLIYTRDYDQWINEMVRHSLVHDFPKIWGQGLTDQIIHFDSRTFHWYRYMEDMKKLKDHMVNKPLTSSVFQPKNHNIFLSNVLKLRQLIKKLPRSTKDNFSHLINIKNTFASVYTYYPLGIFIPGPWKDDFITKHGQDSQKILRMLHHSRRKSEGVLKLTGLYLRSWLGPEMEKLGYLPELFRILTINEVEKFVREKSLPTKIKLNNRSKGFAYLSGKIINVTNFSKFTETRNLFIDSISTANIRNTLQGTTACNGKKVTGKIQTIQNSYEVDNFNSGNILVTPMTSPEYLTALRKAKAIITDEGGLTCHAAITSRELKVPCVIGTKIATQVLKDGDMVEVDADRGVVRKLT